MMGAEEYGMDIIFSCYGMYMLDMSPNTCPVGVCSQDPLLREKFTGTPEKIENLFKFVATEVREILSSLGFKSINEIIGRTDLLSQE